MSAPAIAAELEVSTRTVLRDIEALSTAGVPVYAERGRHGGFALLPGFRAELSGLNHEEALALLTAGSGRGDGPFGLGSALSAALRKVVDALPVNHRDVAMGAASRLLVEPDADLLGRPRLRDDVDAGVHTQVRRAVLAGLRLRIEYATPGREMRTRTVDPVGLVIARGAGYLLATESGRDRTYRLSRIRSARSMTEPAVRDPEVDLAALWRERAARFLADGHLVSVVRVRAARRDDLAEMVVGVLSEEPDGEGWCRSEVAFQDAWHAEWALWQLGPDAEALTPEKVRIAVRERAVLMASRYSP